MDTKDDDVIMLGDLPGADGDRDVVTIAAGDDEVELPKNARKNPDGSVTLTFAYPVVVLTRTGENAPIVEHTTTELKFFRLTGKELSQMAAAPREDVALTGVALATRQQVFRFRPIWERMDGADIVAAQQVIAIFLGNGRRTGQ